MDYQDHVHRCLRLAETLDQSNAWGLTAEQRRHYAERIAALANRHESSPGDDVLATMLAYYHTEHLLVEALVDPDAPGHGAAWRQLEGLVRSLLASRLARGAPGDSAIALDDLAQEAVADLWRGLRNFRYQSRLQTWVFSVTGHCLNRAIRAYRAQKRASMAQAQSLEALAETIGDALPDQRAATPDATVEERELSYLLRRVLASQPDRRLATVLQLWAVEDYSLREIGARMQLSVGRVHGLLAQTQALLRSSPALQTWAGLDIDRAAASSPGEQADGVGL